MSRTVLVTGAAGFIGSHVTQRLLARGDRVVGLDNLNTYYSPDRKRANLEDLRAAVPDPAGFTFVEGDVRDAPLIARLFGEHAFDAVVHLAAMAGVRQSIDDPRLYYDVNLGGTLGLLEASVGRGLAEPSSDRAPTFVFASTSSVYGATRQIPFVESDPCDRPLAPYAASKRAVELLGYTYHQLYGLHFTSLRFFTVYGPRGRPDMMAYKVLDNIFVGREVPLYSAGQMHRDWTYVDDIAAGVVAASDRPLGYELINLGRGEPVLLAEFVRHLERSAGRKAHLVPAPMPDTDMLYTYADVGKAQRLLGYEPKVSVREGVAAFYAWYVQATRSGSGAN